MATIVQRLRQPNVGELKDRLRFQRNNDTLDALGGRTDVWEDYAVLWGRVLPLSSHGVFIARQMENRATHQITIRYSLTSGQINASDRIWMTDGRGERLFIVESSHDLNNKRRWTQVMAFEDTQESEL